MAVIVAGHLPRSDEGESGRRGRAEVGTGEKVVVEGGSMVFVGGWCALSGGGLRSLTVELLAEGDEERVMAETGRRW